VLTHDGVDDDQTQACPSIGGLRREEWLEEPRPSPSIHSDPRVTDPDHDGINQRAVLARRRRTGRDQTDDPAGWHRIASIQDEVHEGAIQLHGVDPDR
jgi:hypothetical protein